MGDHLDTGNGPNREPRPRKSERIALEAEVILRRTGQHHYRVQVYDVSPDGCKVEFVERPNLDETVWVKFDGLEAMEAMVCWLRGAKAGLEFRRPIYQPVFEMLLQRLGAVGPG